MKDMYQHESLVFKVNENTKEIIKNKENIIYSVCEDFVYVYDENDIKCMEAYLDFTGFVSNFYQKSHKDDFYDSLVTSSRKPGKYFYYREEFGYSKLREDEFSVRLKENKFDFEYVFTHSLKLAETYGSPINLGTSEKSKMYFKVEEIK